MFQSFGCHSLALRVFRLFLNGIANFKEFSVHFEKDSDFCFVVWREDELFKKVCVSVESLYQSLPDAELVPMARIMHILNPPQFPLSVRCASPTLRRVFCDVRSDG